jgi:hypothetical protein
MRQGEDRHGEAIVCCSIWLAILDSSTSEALQHVARLLNELAATREDADERELVEQLARETEQRIETLRHSADAAVTETK